MTPDREQQNTTSGSQPTRDMTPDHTVIVDAPRELGCYRLTKLLGRGGMGEVWQAFDTQLERDVAIKLMRKELLTNEDATRRFAREARAVARLNHPNIVQVYAFGDEGGITYFVMELVEGETVAQCLKRKKQIPLDDALHIVLQAIEGLSYANARGIIHRDIKPSNLMITEDFRVKIADFGLAKMVEQDTQMTVAGTAMGSPNYMSPEQARGEEADHRSDIYALGVSLYQMLCGELPFTASSPVSVLLKQIQDPLPEPDGLKILGGGAVINTLKKMTEKTPEGRYQSYGDLANALASLQPNLRFQGAHLPTSSMPAATPPYTPSIGMGSAPLPAAGSSPTPTDSAATVAPSDPGTMITSSKDSDPGSPYVPVSDEKAGKNRGWLYAAVGTGMLILAAVTAWVILSVLPDKEKIDHSAVATETTAPTESPVAEPVASPSPAQASPTAAATAAPVQQTAISSPAPAGMQPVDVTAIFTPRPTPIPGLPTTITPTPTLAELAPSSGQLLIGQADDAAGTDIPLYDVSANPIDTLAAGTQVASIRPATLHGEKWFVIRHNNAEAYVKQSQARRVESASATTPAASVASPAVYVLGIAGDAAKLPVPTYLDNRGRTEYKKFPYGTEVTLVESGVTMSKVQTPDRKTVYIFTKMASPKP